MPEWVFGKITSALNERERAVRGSRILSLGIAYKKNVDDMRESPAVQVMELLRNAGAKLDYSDPHVAQFPPMREHHFDLRSVTLTPDRIASYDCVVLLTDHDEFDYDMIAKHARLLIDSRGRYRTHFPALVRA